MYIVCFCSKRLSEACFKLPKTGLGIKLGPQQAEYWSIALGDPAVIKNWTKNEQEKSNITLSYSRLCIVAFTLVLFVSTQRLKT